MLDFMYVEHADGYPQRCVACDSQSGPFVLTHRRLTFVNGEVWGTVYVCSRCVKTCARVMGLVEGDKADQLLRAADELDAVHRTNEENRAKIEVLSKRLSMAVKTAEENASEAKRQEGRVKQLEERLMDRAQADLALSTQNSGS